MSSKTRSTPHNLGAGMRPPLWRPGRPDVAQCVPPVGPHLVVVPVNVVAHWRREFAYWGPKFRIAVLAGSEQCQQFARNMMKRTPGQPLQYQGERLLKRCSAVPWSAFASA